MLVWDYQTLASEGLRDGNATQHLDRRPFLVAPIAQAQTPTVLTAPCEDLPELTCAIGIRDLDILGATFDIDFTQEGYTTAHADVESLDCEESGLQVNSGDRRIIMIADVPGEFIEQLRWSIRGGWRKAHSSCARTPPEGRRWRRVSAAEDGFAWSGAWSCLAASGARLEATSDLQGRPLLPALRT
ncbi:MAG: hypothetical protein AAGA68_22510 [Pseudomonadota bacterium]